ncbi:MULTISPECIES: alpha/beta hydrolase [unclassified Sinorhizobium]|uniref:alpha/beta hydrolase n=1 Tax=unclassified Sinorhizobium TaxID=2613772 RepID=UPI003523F81A
MEEARAQLGPADAANSLELLRGLDRTAEAKIQTKDLAISSPNGPVRVRIYTPDGREGPYPAIIYFHSGGFVIGNIDAYDQTARRLALHAGAIVLAVDYYKAPEHPFPAAHEDAWAAYLWARDQLETLGGDKERIAVLGESAGGNLAANVAIRAIAENVEAPLIQLLLYPLAGNDMNSASYRENADSIPLGKAGMMWFFKHAFSDPLAQNDPRINLAGRGDLDGLPATTIITGDLDPLRSEGQIFADRLRAAGVAVNAQNMEGLGHEFFGMSKLVPGAKYAMELVVDHLKQAFKL